MPSFFPRAALLLTALTLPWLWPFTAGPRAATQPYLVGIGSTALALLLWPAREPERAARLAALGWLAAAGVSGVIALLQYFDLETPFFPWFNIAEPRQAFGNLRQPNQLASLLVIGVLALRWQVQQGRWPGRAPATALLALLTAALAATASRVGLVELLACGALALGWARAGRSAANADAAAGPRGAAGPGGGRATGWLVGAALLLYLLAVLALPQLAQGLGVPEGRDMLARLRDGSSSCGSRLVLWRNVLELIALRPWLGWGWGELDYAHYMTLYPGARFCYILDNAHNLPLHLAVELGLPAALLACAGLLAVLLRARPWRTQSPTRQLAWGVLAVIGIHSGVEYPLWYAPFQIAALICVWLLWATRRSAGVPVVQADLAAAPSGLASSALWLRPAVAGTLLAAVLYAGWDYHRISQIYLLPAERSAPYRDDAMGQARRSWLYLDLVRFAEVTSQPVTPDNAAWMLPAALRTLHFSPEARVATRVIESAALLGQDELARAHLARLEAAFPRQYGEWVQANERIVERLQAEAAGAEPE